MGNLLLTLLEHRVRRRIPSALGPGHGGDGEIGHAGTGNGRWPGAGFPCALESRGSQWGWPRGKAQERAVGREIQGCPGWEHTPQISPKGCWDYFLRESIAILASSGVAVACIF